MMTCGHCGKEQPLWLTHRFRGEDLCGACLLGIPEPPYLEHYVYSGETNLGYAIEAGPVEAMIHDVRISEYHAVTEMYYRSPRLDVPPYWLRFLKQRTSREG